MIKGTLRLGIAVNVLTFGYVVFSLIYIKELPAYPPYFEDRKVVILLVEVMGGLFCYLIGRHYRVFSRANINIIGILLIWPMIGSILWFLRMTHGLGLLLLITGGGFSILLSIMKLHKLSDSDATF